MSLFLSCIFYFVLQIRKTCYRKKIKNWTFEVYLLTRETSSRFLLIEWVILEFFVKCSLDFFSRPNVLPKLSKKTVTCQNSVKKKIGRVNLKGSSGYSTSVVLVSLPHNHTTLTNLFIYTGTTVIKNLGSKNNSWIAVHRVLVHWGYIVCPPPFPPSF